MRSRTVITYALTGLCLVFLSHGALAAGDSVWVEPSSPTDKDSLFFNLFSFDVCCCGEYHDDAVTVVDTMIILSFSVNTEPCKLCNCFAPGSWHWFKTGPVEAGTYGIYESQSPYCPPGTACPQDASMITFVRVGGITVSGGTSAMRASGLEERLAAASRYSFRNGRLSVSFDESRTATVEIFTAKGARVAVLSRDKYFRPGRYEFEISAGVLRSQVAYVRVSTDNFYSTEAVLYVK